MALTPKQIDRLIQQADGLAPKEGSIFRALVKLTEAEVQKQDTALIRQMLEVLKSSSPYTDIAYGWKEEDWVKRRAAAITSAESFLKETKQHPQPSPSSGAFLLPDEQ